jgi:hypothetical protein
MKIFVAVLAFVGLLLTGTIATAQFVKPSSFLCMVRSPTHRVGMASSQFLRETVIRSSPQPIRCVA